MYNVTSFRSDAAGIIYTCDWTYSNADGSVRGTHVLSTPAGSTPVADITREVLSGWLKDQLSNTSEEFDAQIASEKAESEAAEASIAYTVTAEGDYKSQIS